MPNPYLTHVGHFHKGFFGLLVLVQLHRDISGIRWPSHVKNSHSHQTGDQSGVMCRVQKQLPVGEKISNIATFERAKHIEVCGRNRCTYLEKSNLCGSDELPCSFSSMLDSSMCRRGPTHSCKFSLPQTEK